MIAELRARHPGIDASVGDLGALMRPRAAAGWSAITAWYSLVHLSDTELHGAVAALARTLVPDGVLAVAVHVGDEVRHVGEFFGASVDLDFVFHDSDHVINAFRAAGLHSIEWYLRSSDPDREVDTQRLYVIGRATA